MNFIYAASKLPNLNFKIRFHPTMANAKHDGAQSLKRYLGWIGELNLPNITVSSDKLDIDLDWSDCLVSEYSNVLLEGAALGKFCVALNATNRRNFIEHMQGSGVAMMKCGEDLVSFLIKYSGSSPKKYSKTPITGLY
jgi:hypothetical protein